MRSVIDVDDKAAAAWRQAEQAREEEHCKVELEYRKRLYLAVHKAWKGGFKRPDLERIAEHVCDINSTGETLINAWGAKWNHRGKLSDAELVQLISEASIGENDIDAPFGKPGRLLELAHRFKVDHKAIRDQVVRDLRPVSAPAPAAGKKKAVRKATKK